MTGARRALGTLVVMLAVAACTAPPPAASPDGSATVPVTDASSLRYTCGRFPLGPDVLARVGQAELADHPAAAALRAHLGRPDMDIDWLPDSGWILAGMDATSAEFVAAGDGGLIYSVTVGGDAGQWKVAGWGECRARRVLPPGLGDADWVLAPGQAIGPQTRSFDALVTERDCASGRSSEGRIAGPDILQVDDLLLVTFAVRPQAGDAFTCQGNPATRVTVDLGEPLGDRRLRDGGSLPPRDPAVEP